MKNKSMKKALSLILAVLMIALAIPFTAVTVAAEEAPAAISNLTFVSYKNDGNALTVTKEYPIGNAFDGNRKGNEAWTNDHTGLTKNVKLGENGFEASIGSGDFYGVFIAELDALSDIDTVSIWTPYPKKNKDFANDGYQIYYSTDGKAYTLAEGATFTDMCGDGTNKGANSAAYVGSGPYEHQIDMNGVTAKFIAIAVTATCKSVVSGTTTPKYNMTLGEFEVVGTHKEATESPEENTDGNVLYAVDFNSTESGFSFSDGDKNWSKTDAVVSEDGRSVTIKSTNSNNRKENELMAKYWTKMPSITVAGKSYTVEFTLDSTVPVGVLLDCGSGFVINPSTNTVSIGRYHVETEIAGNKTYDGSSASKQTYAIELSNASTTAKNYNNYDAYYPIVYRLYVKNEAAGTWSLIREISSEHAKEFEWETGGWEMLYMSFARYDGVSDTTSTISNVTIKNGIGLLPTINLVDGASMRMSSNSGLRFTGIVGKQYVDGLKAKYGEANVTLGMLITPTDYLKDNSLAFTKETLDAYTAITGAKYLEVDAATVLEEGNNYKVNCAIVDILEANYDRAFSAILYVKVTDGDTVTYTYSAYNETENSRTVADVAAAAYADVADQQSDEYPNEVVIDGTTKYSPYTEAQRTTLKAFFQ